MAFDVSGLSAYIEEQNFPLITKAVTGGRTASLMEKQVGVKGATKINLMDVDVNFQDGSGCAFNADGDVTFTQREISPAKLKLNMEFCPKTLEGYYLRSQLPSGAHYESIPFEEQFGAYLVEKIQSELEVMIWQSDSTLVSTNLQFFDGLIDVIGAGSYIDANTASFGSGTPLATALTANNMIEAVQRVYEAAAAAIVDKADAKIFVGYDAFRSLAVGLQSGLGIVTSGGGQLQNADSSFADLTMVLPGTNIEIIAVNGLTGTNDVYCMRTSNMFLGVDLEEDASRIEAWYSKDDRKYKVAVDLTLGVQVAYPDQISAVIL